MNEAPVAVFREAILAAHAADAVSAGQEHVVERFDGDVVWEGDVLIFDLQGHPTATRCYAWEVEGTVTAVLHAGPVDSPLAAVRASILAG